MTFPRAQNSTFVNCSFSEHNGNINTYQNSTTASSSGALQILWNTISPGAAYNSEERYPQPRCLPHTRVDTIRNIEKWADSGGPVLWLHGPAGAGKSAVAQTMCEKWAEAGMLLASFFISRTAPTRNTIDRFVITIAYQAIVALTGCLDPILSIIEKTPHVLQEGIGVQLKTLLIGPLKRLFGNGPESRNQKGPFIIIIDAVDECTGDQNQLRLLFLILSLLHPEHALPLRFLIVSRPESHITHAFNSFLKSVSSVESLYGAHVDVYRYLEVEFARIHNSERHSEMMMHIPKPWPGHEVLRKLTASSCGYFIYAATIVRHIDEEGYFCNDRLKEILDRNARAPGSYPYRELDKVYSQVLSKARNIHTVKRILGCVIVGISAPVVSYDSLPVNVCTSSVISTLFSFRPGELEMALRGLRSIISLSSGVRGSDDISFYHASFSDYLLDPERSGEYHINLEAVTQDISLSSLGLLRNPSGLERSTPSQTWLVAITCWEQIECPRELLLGYLRENAPSLPSAIRWSKDSDEGTQLRLLAVFCQMIIRLKDYEPAKDIVNTLSEMCQSALAMYFSHDDKTNAREIIQVIRALNEASVFNPPRWVEPWTQVVALCEPLGLSPVEQSCSYRFLLWKWLVEGGVKEYPRVTRFQVEMVAGSWHNLRETLKEIIHKFLDNERHWGDACHQKVRKRRARVRLAGSTAGRQILDELDNPLKYLDSSVYCPARTREYWTTL